MAKPKIYRVAVLGTGYIADYHLKALKKNENVQLVAVCDQNRDRAQAAADRYGIPTVYTSLKELTADKKVDVVHNLLPPNLHHKTTKALLNSGKHVLLEKPMATSKKEAAQLTKLAKRKKLTLGVSHNFLFAPPYQQLLDDLADGRFGKLNEVRVIWNRELPPMKSGPFHMWLTKEPGNVIFDVGLHSVAHMLHLLDEVEEPIVMVNGETTLPNGSNVYRSWSIQTNSEETNALLTYCFDQGYDEHRIEVRGALGSAVVDLGRSHYHFSSHTKYGDDVDRYMTLVREGRQAIRSARRNFINLVRNKLGLTKEGHPYQTTFHHAIDTFYEQIGKELDPRLSPELGEQAVGFCEEIIEESGLGKPKKERKRRARKKAKVDVLLIGGTGFIGKATLRKLIEEGKSVRVLARTPLAMLPKIFHHPMVTVVSGDLTNMDSVRAALKGAKSVIHLATAGANSMEEYIKNDIEPTRRLGELCLKMGIERLVYTGSIASYDSGSSEPITEESPFNPQLDRCNPYARCKAMSEEALLELHQEKGLPVVIFRPGIVLGEESSPFHWGIAMWKRKNVCQLWGDGLNPLPIVLVDDVADALVKGVDTPDIEGRSFNLIGDVRFSAEDYILAMEKAMNARIEVVPTPVWKYFAVDVGKWMVKQLVKHPNITTPSYKEWQGRTQRAEYDCTTTKKVLAWKPTASRDEVIRKGVIDPVNKWCL